MLNESKHIIMVWNGMEIKLLSSIQLIIKRGVVSPWFWIYAPALFWAQVARLVARVALRWDHNVTVAPNANASPASIRDDDGNMDNRKFFVIVHWEEKNDSQLSHVGCRPRKDSFFRIVILTFLSSYVDKLEVKEGGIPGVGTALRFPSNLACKSY